jgi:hypothetical protein
MQIFFGW